MSGTGVAAFPYQPGRSWRILEAGLRGGLSEGGSSPAEVDHVCAVIRPLWAQFAATPKPDVSSGGEAAANIADDWIKGIVLGFMAEVAKREATLFQHGLAATTPE